MAEVTGMTLTIKDAAMINEVARVFKETLKKKIGDTYTEDGFKEFVNDLTVKDNTMQTESSYAFTGYEFETLIKEALIKVAAEVNEEYSFKADAWSNQCGYEAFIEANYNRGILAYKIVASENMMGCCPECGEDVVYYTEYDPSKTYTCPECGEALSEEEMFPDGVPTWEVEEIRIKR